MSHENRALRDLQRCLWKCTMVSTLRFVHELPTCCLLVPGTYSIVGFEFRT